MIKLIYLDEFTRESVENDPDYLYIFTDNLMRSSGSNICQIDSYYKYYYGLSKVSYPITTQAVIRGLKNAFPISTMRNSWLGQFSESDYEMMDDIWNCEVNNILAELPKYKGIKCSSAQFGNGRYSRIHQVPELFNCLNKHLLRLGIDNVNRFK